VILKIPLIILPVIPESCGCSTTSAGSSGGSSKVSSGSSLISSDSSFGFSISGPVSFSLISSAGSSGSSSGSVKLTSGSLVSFFGIVILISG
jgi:hypothetical protein